MKNILILFVICSFGFIGCKKSVSPTPVPSPYYITCSINGAAKNYSNAAICNFSDTVIAGENVGSFLIQGASPTLPVEGIQIIILNIDTSNATKWIFADTSTSYGAICNHFVPGNIDYSTVPFGTDTVSSINPFQITINSISNGIINGTFKGNLNDTNTGTTVDAITDGKFNLHIKYN
jgi:hypothetical protein